MSAHRRRLLHYRGTDERGVDYVTGDYVQLPMIVFLMVGGCFFLGLPLWVVITNKVTPRYWVPPWDQYLGLAFAGLIGIGALLFSFRMLGVWKQMKGMCTLRNLSRMTGENEENVALKLESGNLQPELNVNGVYYWDVSKLPFAELLLRPVVNGASPGELLRAARDNSSNANENTLLRTSPDDSD